MATAHFLMEAELQFRTPLKRNSSVTNAKFLDDCDYNFCNTLAAVLLSNTTLQSLTVRLPDGEHGIWISSIFLSLGMNQTLKSFTSKIFDHFGDELCAAITSGLAKNATLEELSLYDMLQSDDDGVVSSRRALSFLRTNTTLKSLALSFELAKKESFGSTFRLEAVKMMKNSSLEKLSISTGDIITFEELLALVIALKRNTTLKSLGYQFSMQIFPNSLSLNHDEVNQLVSILIKKYGLERLVIRFDDDRTVKAILRLNGAGRRYLIEDGSSISKGVEVLSSVNDEIYCVFLHLLENPGLCNRRAIDAATT